MSYIKSFLNVIRAVLLALVSIVAVFGAAGDVDLTFNAYLGDVSSGRVLRTIIQPDGKIIATGEFTLVNGAARTNIVRLNPDGTIDPTFTITSIPTTGAGLAIQAIGLQSDGKIVIVGQFSFPRSGIARLNADGTPDASFNSSAALNNVWIGSDLKITADDKIVFSSIKIFTSITRNYLTRLNANGTLDTESELTAPRLTVQPDGKILIADSLNGVTRLNQNLTTDNTFTQVSTNGGIGEIVVQPDGKILIGGSFSTINGSPLSRIARINTNGSVDTTFNINVAGPNSTVNTVELLSNGKIFIGGLFGMFNGTVRDRTALLNAADGSLDNSYSPATNFNEIYDVDIQPDGKILVSGLPFPSATHNMLVRLNPNGSLDTSFQAVLGAAGRGFRVVVQPDNKILVGGNTFNFASGAARSNLAKFNADGTLETGFVPVNSSSGIVDAFSDGKVITKNNPDGVTRLNANGSLDVTYNFGGGAVGSVKALTDGRALVSYSGFGFRRYNANGSLDNTFFVNVGIIYRIVLQPDGKILIGGTFSSVNGTNRGNIARLNADGSLDTSFNPPGGANGTVYDIDLQADGKVLIGGFFTSVNFDANRKYAARLNADGSLDTSFTPTIDAVVYAVKAQTDGKVLIGGVFANVSNTPRSRYARLNANGSLDTAFNVGSGANAAIWDIDLQSDGKIIMVGDFSSINGSPRFGIVRLLNAPTVSRTPFDYDGDGRADVSVFRPSENKWYIFQSSDGQIVQRIFAIGGDVPTPADFDGDGKTDVSVFRPSLGDWWSLSSINNNQVFTHWGASNDIPRPSDFDGDGRADYVVFRPAENNWYRISSANGFTSNRNFGLSGDKPVTGDFDGDGKSDVAIFRPSTGDWWYQSSINNAQLATRWGISSDIPAPSDFDGDGKTDFAVYRPSSGTWYILNSSNGQATIINFGISEDKPVAADYDGDGKSDIAVFRPSTGIWYLLRSTAGFTALQFGVSTDIPTQNAFVP